VCERGVRRRVDSDGHQQKMITILSNMKALTPHSAFVAAAAGGSHRHAIRVCRMCVLQRIPMHPSRETPGARNLGE
jgi:hypothetical protein